MANLPHMVSHMDHLDNRSIKATLILQEVLLSFILMRELGGVNPKASEEKQNEAETYMVISKCKPCMIAAFLLAKCSNTQMDLKLI